MLCRKNGHFLITENSVSLPRASQGLGQTSKPVPKERAEQPPISNKGGTVAPSSVPAAQQPESPPIAAKQKHANAAHSKPGVKADDQQTAAATEAPSKKRKKRKKVPASAAGSAQPAAQIDVPEIAEEVHASQPTDSTTQQLPVNEGPTSASQGVEKKKKRKRKKPDAAVDQPAQPLHAAATAGAALTAKRQKKAKEPAEEQAATSNQNAETAEPAPADNTARKKKKKARNEAAPDEATQAESMEKGQEAAAPQGRKAGKATIPDVKGTPGGADTGLSWRQDLARKDVKRGRFSLSERETIKQAVKVCNSW